MTRDNYLPTIRLSDEEWGMLEQLARDHMLALQSHGGKAQIIRLLIREAAARRVPHCPTCGAALQLQRLTDIAVSLRAPGTPAGLPKQTPFSHAWVCPNCGYEDIPVAGGEEGPAPKPKHV